MLVEVRTRDHVRLLFAPSSMGLEDAAALQAATGCNCFGCFVIRNIVLDAARRLAAIEPEGSC